MPRLTFIRAGRVMVTITTTGAETTRGRRRANPLFLRSDQFGSDQTDGSPGVKLGSIFPVITMVAAKGRRRPPRPQKIGSNPDSLAIFPSERCEKNLMCPKSLPTCQW